MWTDRSHYTDRSEQFFGFCLYRVTVASEGMGSESPAVIDARGRPYMAATDTAERRPSNAVSSKAGRTPDETKNAFKTTEFFAMVGIIAAILIASAVSDSFGDRRA